MWIYDGAPDQDEVRLNIAPPDIEKGGHLVLFFLDNGFIRLVSTLHPARSVAGWKNSARRYGGSGLSRIIISSPYVKYHDLKRKVLKEIGLSDGPIPSSMADNILEKASSIFIIQTSISKKAKIDFEALRNHR